MTSIPWGYIAAIFVSAIIGYCYGQLQGWREGYSMGRFVTYQQLRQSGLIDEPMDKEFR